MVVFAEPRAVLCLLEKTKSWPACSVIHIANAIIHPCLWFTARSGAALQRARKMVLFFIFMNDHIIYLEPAKHQQVLMQAASRSSQQTV